MKKQVRFDLEEETYIKFRKMLLEEKKTVKKSLTEFIENKIKKK
jgi:hypothetical protein